MTRFFSFVGSFPAPGLRVGAGLLFVLAGCTDLDPARSGYGLAEAQKIQERIQADLDLGNFTTETCAALTSTGNRIAVSLLFIDELRLTISTSCNQRSGKLACGALDGLLAIPGKDVTRGRGSPSFYYCAPAGGVNTAVACAAGEDGFCEFPDGSLIDNWALVNTPNSALGREP